AMMDRHMLIDLSHASEKAVRDYYRLVVDDDTPRKYRYYPFLQSHSRFREVLGTEMLERQREFVTTDEQIGYLKKLGGIVGVRTSPDKIDGKGTGDVVANTCHGSSRSIAQLIEYGYRKHVAMAMGTDFNGSTPQVGPRFGPEACPDGGKADGQGGTGFAV